MYILNTRNEISAVCEELCRGNKAIFEAFSGLLPERVEKSIERNQIQHVVHHQAYGELNDQVSTVLNKNKDPKTTNPILVETYRDLEK